MKGRCDLPGDYDDESELVTYVWNHFSRFFTPAESKAGWAVYADHMRADMAELVWKTEKLAQDPAVMALLADV